MRPEWQEAERAARAALATHAETASLAVATFEPIAGSLSNFAWHVSATGQDRFVRYARAGNEQLGADLHAEGEILRLVAEAGLAPRVVRCDPSARLLVTQWIARAKDDPSPGGCDRTIRQVAAMLCQLHQLTPPTGVRVVDFAVQVVPFATCVVNRHTGSPVVQEVRPFMQRSGDVQGAFSVHGRHWCAALQTRLGAVPHEVPGGR